MAPTHGPSGAPFTVEYREPASGLILGSCSADPVTVTFDGGTLGRAPLSQQGTECVATLSAAPGAGPGASTAAADPPSPDGPGRGSPSRPAITMPGPNGSGRSSATPWVLAGGALLILGDLALLALLSARTRRRPGRGQPSTG